MKACFDWVCATMDLRCKEVIYVRYTRYIFYNNSYKSVNERDVHNISDMPMPLDSQ